MKKQAIETILFDLDGTLLDTAPDLAFALNYVLQEQQREPLPFDTIRPWVSHGAEALIRYGFNLTDTDPQTESLRQRLVEIYAAHIAEYTCLFSGMAEVLTTFRQKNIKWGIVTNKLHHLTTPLVEKLGLSEQSVCTISGDTLPQKKPDPAPLLYACQLAKTHPEHCIYVGDAQRDIEAGQRAGMRTLVALYGYLGVDDNPKQWGATGMLHTPLDLLTWLE